MRYKYGEFTQSQISYTKSSIRKSIFFLLLCVDPNTRKDYSDIDVNKTFENLLHRIGGLNDVLLYPPEIVMVISLLKEAQKLYNSNIFDFSVYRKLILDAGSEVLKIKERDYDD